MIKPKLVKHLCKISKKIKAGSKIKIYNGSITVHSYFSDANMYIYNGKTLNEIRLNKMKEEDQKIKLGELRFTKLSHIYTKNKKGKRK